MAFDAGDKVRYIEGTDSLLEHGKVYTVFKRSRSGNGVELVEFRGKSAYNTSAPWWYDHRFELAGSEDPLEELKNALAALRESGYEVKITVTRTVVEEL